MPHPVWALRKAAMVLIAACSIVGALVLVWQVVTVDRIAMLSNGQLLGVLALFLLPWGTLAAWEFDRRAALGVEQQAALESPALVARPPVVARHEERQGPPGREEPRGRPDRHRHQASPLPQRDRAAKGRV